MSNNFNLHALWQSQPAAVAPGIDELVAKAAAYKKKARNKLLFSNLLLLLTAVFVIGIALYYHSQVFTTRLGVALVIASVLLYIIATGGSLQLLYKSSSPDTNSHAFLQHLISLKKKQEFLQTTILSLYFILLSAGICLYMIEYTARMSILWAVVTYCITIAWIAFNWLYIRPRNIRKQRQPLVNLINTLQKIDNQFSEV